MRVDDGDVVADPDILVDNGVDDRAVVAYPDMRHPLRDILLQFLRRLVIVRPHDDGILDRGPASDAGSNADDGALDVRPRQDAPFGDDRLMYVAVVHLGTRQLPQVGIDRHLCIVEVELRQAARQIQVCLIERSNGSDICPVIVE